MKIPLGKFGLKNITWIRQKGVRALALQTDPIRLSRCKYNAYRLPWKHPVLHWQNGFGPAVYPNVFG